MTSYETTEQRDYRATNTTDGAHEASGATNLRLAFGIWGALIAGGMVNVDLSDPRWAEKADASVMAIASVLNQFG